MDIPACIARLTGKDAKDACAYTSRIVEESRGSARWFPCLEAVAAQHSSADFEGHRRVS